MTLLLDQGTLIYNTHDSLDNLDYKDQINTTAINFGDVFPSYLEQISSTLAYQKKK